MRNRTLLACLMTAALAFALSAPFVIADPLPGAGATKSTVFVKPPDSSVAIPLLSDELGALIFDQKGLRVDTDRCVWGSCAVNLDGGYLEGTPDASNKQACLDAGAINGTDAFQIMCPNGDAGFQGPAPRFDTTLNYTCHSSVDVCLTDKPGETSTCLRGKPIYSGVDSQPLMYPADMRCASSSGTATVSCCPVIPTIVRGR
jgi:hypothetical protein